MDARPIRTHHVLAAVLLGLTVGCDSAGGQDRSPITVDLEACPDGGPPDRNALLYGQIDRDPAWSPDGRRLAYLRLSRDSRRHELWLLDLHTGVQRMLRDGVGQVAWFPSGDSLLVSLEAHHFHVLDLNGNELRALSARGFFPDVSPDGRYLAWDFDRAIHVLDLDTGDQWEIGPSEGWRGGSWSPDGTRYAHLRYEEGPSGSTVVYTMAADGANPERVTFAPVYHRTPKWSPDARYIAFTSRGCPGQEDIMAIDLSTDKRLLFTSEGGYGMSWSPDSERIAYVRYNPRLDPEEHRDEGQGYVHILDIYTGASRQVTFPTE